MIKKDNIKFIPLQRRTTDFEANTTSFQASTAIGVVQKVHDNDLAKGTFGPNLQTLEETLKRKVWEEVYGDVAEEVGNILELVLKLGGTPLDKTSELEDRLRVLRQILTTPTNNGCIYRPLGDRE